MTRWTRERICELRGLPTEVASELAGTTPDEWDACAVALVAIQINRRADAAIRTAAGRDPGPSKPLVGNNTFDQQIRARAGRPPAPNDRRSNP